MKGRATFIEENKLKLLYLRERTPWFGGHSGYEQLTSHIPGQHEMHTVRPRSGQLARYAGSAYARLRGRPGRGATSLSDLEFRLRRAMGRPDASHILYLEHHLELLNGRSESNDDLLGTLHLPPSAWKADGCALLGRYNSALVLYQKDIPFFEQHLGKGRVHFIHHGADTEFFRQEAGKPKGPPRILYSGVYLRNEAMLVRVLQELVKAEPELRFDLLVPRHHRNSPALAPLLEHPAVTWHAGLNDEQLRELYRQSYLMLLPMNDSGANTAVVEALASGLPIVTTDVGGIRDYGGAEIFPVVANNNDAGMAALVKDYLARPDWRDETARKCRAFAVEKLAWPMVAQKHVELYGSL